MKEKFIVTSNPESAALLIKLGMNPMFDDGHSWIFLNNNKLVFQDIDGLTFTNNLFI